VVELITENRSLTVSPSARLARNSQQRTPGISEGALLRKCIVHPLGRVAIDRHEACCGLSTREPSGWRALLADPQRIQ